MSAAVSKYRAKKTTVNGITFASMAEARRYSALRLLEMHGAIAHLRVQPVYACSVSSALLDKGPVATFKYVADFEYLLVKENKVVAEDVKGVRTSTYLLKIKIARVCYPNITFVEVR